MDPLENERDVDQWLELELSRHGKVEPRDGLDGRVLANLQAERNRIVARSRWWWTAATFVAAAAIVAAVWVGDGVHKDGVHTHNLANLADTSTKHGEDVREAIHPAPTPIPIHPAVELAQRRFPGRTVGGGSPNRAVAAVPKLGQFPSLRPLSEQEQILMSYVAKYPEKAALIAQATAEALRRDREEEAAAARSGTE